LFNFYQLYQRLLDDYVVGAAVEIEWNNLKFNLKDLFQDFPNFPYNSSVAGGLVVSVP
jgi:hypothetical protein